MNFPRAWGVVRPWPGILCLALLWVGGARADSSVAQLSPATRALLGQEMRALEQGMHQLLSAHIAGDMARVAQLAGQIKGGYIMRKQLSQAQRQELVATLPEDFKQRDQVFHRSAGMLKHVADDGHTELVSFYYLKMMDACIGCHSRYATHRFPALRTAPDNADVHHH